MSFKSNIAVNVSRVNAPTDAFERFCALCSELNLTEVESRIRTVVCTVHTNFRDIEVVGEIVSEVIKDFLADVPPQFFMFETIQKIGITGASNGGQNLFVVDYNDPGPQQRASYFNLSSQEMHAISALALSFLASVDRHYQPVAAQVVNTEALAPELRQLYIEQADSFAKQQETLRRAHQDLLRFSEDERRKTSLLIDETKRNASSEIEAAYVKIADRESGLERARSDLLKEREELNDRAARHARRHNQNAFLEQLKTLSTEGMKYTASAESRRVPVYVLGGLLASAGVALYAFAFGNFVKGTAQSVYFYPPMITGAAFFLAGLIVLIRFSQRWAAATETEERRAHHTALDFQRAAWVVELLFEWRKENPNQPFPDAVLQTLSSGLFQDHTTTTTINNAKQNQLLTLIDKGSIAELAIGKDSGRVVFSNQQPPAPPTPAAS
jgi:hypothetical protein